MQEKISVIITTYKRKFNILSRAINSVLNQTYQNIEIIVVNDNSIDNTFFSEIEENIKKYQNQIKYISYPDNKGACAARNLGALEARGKYIAFLDDDDVFRPDKIERQVYFLHKLSADFVTCSYATLGENRKNRKVNVNQYKIIKRNKIWKRNCIGGCSEPLMSKEVFIKAGMFMENLPQSQDYDLWIRIAKICKIYKINEELVEYSREDENSISKNYKKIIIASKMLAEKYKNEKEAQEFIKRMYYVIAYSLICMNEKNKAKIYYEKGKQIKKSNIYIWRYKIKIMCEILRRFKEK